MKIEKRGYSVNPWRLVDNDGLEVPGRIKLVDPSRPEKGAYRSNVSGRTKTECIENALDLLQQLYDKAVSHDL